MKTRQPSIRQLEYFVTVAKASNFRKAAERLNISQPTLTSQIATLEASMGVVLFERSRAGTLLSTAGRELLPIARNVLEQYQALLDHAESNAREISGTFRIGISPTIGPYLLPAILPVLHARYPRLRLHVREAFPRKLETGLDDGSYDLIITVMPMDSNEYKVRPLFTEPLQAVMSLDHALAGNTQLASKELHNQEVLTISEQHLNRQIANLCELYGAQLQREIEGTSLDTLCQMAVMGMGIAFLPGLYIRSEVGNQDKLRVLALPGEQVHRTHVAAWRRNSSSRHLFQKISYDIKSIALDQFDSILEEVKTDDNF